MKKILLMSALAGVLAASSALASDTTKDKKDTESKAAENAKSPRVESPKASDGVLVTGSYIKQDVRRHGRITDGVNNVVVLDRKTINESGAASVRQLLIKTGTH